MNLTACGNNRERSHSITNLFLTGPPGTGKTTLLFFALKACLPLDARWPDRRPAPAESAPAPWRGWPGVGGFVVKRVYRAGRRVALDLVDLGTGQRATLVSFPAPGPPRVAPEAFAGVGVPAIRRALDSSRVVVMDELGRFELGSPAFLAAVGEALASPVPVVGVLKAESNPFLDSIRARPDTVVISLDPADGDPASRAPDFRQAAEARFAAALAELLRAGGEPSSPAVQPS